MPEATEFLVGAWSLLECAEILQDGSKRFPFGEHVLGQVVYAADGHMSVQMLRAGRAAFASADYMSAPDEIAAEAFRQYF